MQVDDEGTIQFKKLSAGPITHDRVSLCEDDIDVSGLLEGDLINAGQSSILASFQITGSGFLPVRPRPLDTTED